jgi:hypothetical protein
MRDWTFRFGISWYFTDGLEAIQNGVSGSGSGSGSGKPAGVGGF